MFYFENGVLWSFFPVMELSTIIARGDGQAYNMESCEIFRRTFFWGGGGHIFEGSHGWGDSKTFWDIPPQICMSIHATGATNRRKETFIYVNVTPGEHSHT